MSENDVQIYAEWNRKEGAERARMRLPGVSLALIRDLRAERDEARKALREREAEYTELKRRLATVTSERDEADLIKERDRWKERAFAVQDTLDCVRKERDDLKRRVDDLLAGRSSFLAEITDVTEECDELKQERDELKRKLAEKPRSLGEFARDQHREQLDAIVEQLRQVEREMNESNKSTDVDIATAIRLLERES